MPHTVCLTIPDHVHLIQTLTIHYLNRGIELDFESHPLRYVVLGLLMSEPKHGYSLFQDFETDLSLIWRAGRSKFYAELASLEEHGFLTQVVEHQEARPPRKIYHLTENGRTTFLEWLHTPVTPLRQVRIELLAKLHFFDFLRLPGASDLIDAQISSCSYALEKLRARQSENEDTLLDTLAYEFRIGQVEAMVTWLERCKSHINQTRQESL